MMDLPTHSHQKLWKGWWVIPQVIRTKPCGTQPALGIVTFSVVLLYTCHKLSKVNDPIIISVKNFKDHVLEPFSRFFIRNSLAIYLNHIMTWTSQFMNWILCTFFIVFLKLLFFILPFGFSLTNSSKTSRTCLNYKAHLAMGRQHD